MIRAPAVEQANIPPDASRRAAPCQRVCTRRGQPVCTYGAPARIFFTPPDTTNAIEPLDCLDANHTSRIHIIIRPGNRDLVLLGSHQCDILSTRTWDARLVNSLNTSTSTSRPVRRIFLAFYYNIASSHTIMFMSFCRLRHRHENRSVSENQEIGVDNSSSGIIFLYTGEWTNALLSITIPVIPSSIFLDTAFHNLAQRGRCRLGVVGTGGWAR